MLASIKKNLVFWLFGVLLLTSLFSLVRQSGQVDAYEDWYGSEKIKIAQDFSGSAPLEQCLAISKQQLLEFDDFMGGFKKLVIHTDKSKRRGLSNGELIYIRCLENEEEFKNVLIHEIGHVVDLTYLNGSSEAKNSNFHDFGDPVKTDDSSASYYKISWHDTDSHKHGAHKHDFVSKYGATDPFEDFAETFLMYVRYGEFFRYLAFGKDNVDLQKKYMFMKAEVFEGKEFNLDRSLDLSGLRFLRHNYAPVFDMTKMHNLV